MSTPRIAPGSREEIGLVNDLISRAIGAAAGGGPPNVFTTLARHRGLFRRWLLFAGKLMPGGSFRRRDAELVILRVAHNTGSAYEWHQHAAIAQTVGLTAEDVQRVREGADAPGWNDRQRLFIRAADALHADRDIGDELWSDLSAAFDERELIELCLLVGHYEMLAMTLNALRVQTDDDAMKPSPLLQRIAGRLG